MSARAVIGWGLALTLAAQAALAADTPARAQTVYFNAWGGDPAINRYIEWAAARVRAEHGIELRHVKVGDISEAVVRLQAEHAAGRHTGGRIDLLWINGENFAALKRDGLLHGPWARDVDGAARIDWSNPTMRRDGGLATDGFELPWGTASLTFFYDRKRVGAAPDTPAGLMRWIKSNPGRFTYVQPPAFIGTAFLKQLLGRLAADPARLQRPVGDDFERVTAPLWHWLDRAHPDLWRRGRLFPLSGPAQRELLAVGEVDWMLSYNPSEASRAIGQNELPPTIGALHMAGGALANSHFLAIPYNSAAIPAAARVAAFFISPQAQAAKADETIWGDGTVLNRAQLTAAERALFDTAVRGPATPPAAARSMSEPHPSWNDALEAAWIARYTR